MDVILLERNRNLGNLGDKITVKTGYARNYLIPQGKAALATEKNLRKFEDQRVELEQKSAADLQAAQARADKLADKIVIITAKVGEEGKLFGSISTREIAAAVTRDGVKVEKGEVRLPTGPLRYIGEYDINLQFHSEVAAVVKIKIAAE
ncbi:50S ribosomal protein L9 [soil metagenome]